MERPLMCYIIPHPEVIPVSDNATGDERRNDVPQLPDGVEPVESIEAYEIDEGVVLYDADNPLAWLQSSQAVPIGETL